MIIGIPKSRNIWSARADRHAQACNLVVVSCDVRCFIVVHQWRNVVKNPDIDCPTAKGADTSGASKPWTIPVNENVMRLLLPSQTRQVQKE